MTGCSDWRQWCRQVESPFAVYPQRVSFECFFGVVGRALVEEILHSPLDFLILRCFCSSEIHFKHNLRRSYCRLDHFVLHIGGSLHQDRVTRSEWALCCWPSRFWTLRRGTSSPQIAWLEQYKWDIVASETISRAQWNLLFLSGEVNFCLDLSDSFDVLAAYACTDLSCEEKQLLFEYRCGISNRVVTAVPEPHAFSLLRYVLNR